MTPFYVVSLCILSLGIVSELLLTGATCLSFILFSSCHSESHLHVMATASSLTWNARLALDCVQVYLRQVRRKLVLQVTLFGLSLVWTDTGCIAEETQGDAIPAYQFQGARNTAVSYVLSLNPLKFSSVPSPL